MTMMIYKKKLIIFIKILIVRFKLTILFNSFKLLKILQPRFISENKEESNSN